MGRLEMPEDVKWTAYMHHVQPLLQEGPSCGLVALEMASAYLGSSKLALKGRDLPYLLQIARANDYTRKGEMFTADHLSTLALNVYGMKSEVLTWDEDLDIASHLHHGGLCLLAYDKDGNNEPCLKSGTKAHWALINGYVVARARDGTPTTLLT
ncbi:hypothetical protein BC829DRAFT_246642 [Chytridium lagenaria]|nr:hypothetical protein BC829DRAFT_246642 [Chytridium lagenaria]